MRGRRRGRKIAEIDPPPIILGDREIGQRSKQLGGSHGQNGVLSGPGEIGKLEDVEGNSKVVSHDDHFRVISAM